MKWKSMAIGRKVFLGYAMLLALTVICFFSVLGADEGRRHGVDAEHRMVAKGENHEFLFLGLVTVSAFLLAVFISRGINASLKEISDTMDETATRIDASSYEVSRAGQSLAAGVSQQAGVLDETASSVEETAELSKANAERAGEADRLIKTSSALIEDAEASMKMLTVSMDEIRKAGEETQKIVRAIDEIAFQTNLLALNAAVEAARAGEAGAGFAVVAEEVRNLAGRAGEAARRTAELIENTVKSVHHGSDLLDRTSGAFSQVGTNIMDARELMSEIVQASKEQTAGVTRVNQAIAELNQVIRQNSTDAERTAQVSDELGTQGEQMREVIGRLISLVTGKTEMSREELVSVRESLYDLVDHPILASPDPSAHREVLGHWLAANPKVEAVYTNRPDGTFIYSEPPAGIPNACIRPWWQKAIKGEEYVSPAYISAITQRPCCTISIPIPALHHGEVAGVLGIDVKVG